MGALTSKSYSLSYRSWEFQSSNFLDFFEITATPLRLDFYTDADAFRVLPRYNFLSEKKKIITDKCRFFIDSLKKCRFFTPLIKKKLLLDNFDQSLGQAVNSLNTFLIQSSWNFSLNFLGKKFKEYNGGNLFFDLLFGNFFDLRFFSSLKDFFSLIAPFSVKIIHLPFKGFLDFRENFLFLSKEKEFSFSL